MLKILQITSQAQGISVSKEKKRKILVVDDEPDNASVFTMSLEDGGFEVDTFTDPLLALSTFKAGKKYDLLILDIKMANMNGFDLYDAVRKVDNKVKACFLTAFGEGYTEEFERRFPSSLFSDISFIRKPIRMDDLVKKVNEVI
jgi:two-component system aerobic respiration control sensor histidine kinase ArcB